MMMKMMFKKICTYTEETWKVFFQDNTSLHTQGLEKFYNNNIFLYLIIIISVAIFTYILIKYKKHLSLDNMKKNLSCANILPSSIVIIIIYIIRIYYFGDIDVNYIEIITFISTYGIINFIVYTIQLFNDETMLIQGKKPFSNCNIKDSIKIPSYYTMENDNSESNQDINMENNTPNKVTEMVKLTEQEKTELLIKTAARDWAEQEKLDKQKAVNQPPKNNTDLPPQDDKHEMPKTTSRGSSHVSMDVMQQRYIEFEQGNKRRLAKGVEEDRINSLNNSKNV